MPWRLSAPISSTPPRSCKPSWSSSTGSPPHRPHSTSTSRKSTSPDTAQSPIVQSTFLPLHQTYLIDIHVLNDKAFSTPSPTTGHALEHVLESDSTQKDFGVRNDSNALSNLFHIRLTGIINLQRMELARRTFPRGVVSGLARCIERDSLLSKTEQSVGMVAKRRGRRLLRARARWEEVWSILGAAAF
ncbi:uncharacterized protein B0T15DRAFT_531349 [Chaetomium strumarium]|uniref:Uncharacterized protein n=1 Tax=Chaetomium strumarium TaxID=1170767 RepID=A0AAJ0M141_9PEZI|nr:hypothetical protein B0T15DRAFT_531349 [Chaetomium strumarium]